MTAELDQFALFTGLIGGLALFLYGMDIMTRALKRVAGDYMKTMLARMTSNRFVGVATGATVTAVIQSSSITTVLLVGFISAGLMSTSQSVAVILGANIGTTVTAQILAFKVTKIALPILAAGFFVSFTAKREEWRQYGLIVLGLGLVFFGMAIMSDAMKPLRSYQPFLDFMVSLDHLLLAALVGAAFTAVIQSSSATTGILIVMAGQGLIGLEAAIALALGANIGTCVTAALASIGKPREAVRTAVVHILFNVAGVAIWIGLVSQLAELARLISPAHPELTGLARTAAEIPRQVANVHTFFNVVNAALFIGFTAQITRLVEWLVPDRPLGADERLAPRYLDEQLLGTPAIALDATRREIVRLGGLVRDMLEAVIPPATSGTRLQLDQLKAMDKPVDILHRQIIGYLRQVSLGNLSSHQSDLLIALIKIANDLEHIGDQIATNIVASSHKRIDEKVVISRPTALAITDLHGKVIEAFDQTLAALDQEDRTRATQVRAMKQDFADIIEQIAEHEIARLQADEPRRLMTYAREIELIEVLDDIFKTTRRIARTQIGAFEAASSDEPAPAAEIAS
ncbi:MAG: Na/Pi cotransporter family protein [Hyphomicrobiales bacterium]